MRPFRSFLLLLIFLICFTGLHYIVPAKNLFPPVNEFIPSLLKDSIIQSAANSVPLQSSLSDTVPPGDITGTIPARTASADPVTIYDPLRSFMDSLRSDDQIRIIYYGDSQIEGDRMTSNLRESLRQIAGGTGPGLFLPAMPVMFTKTLSVRSSADWVRYNYLSFQRGSISHRKFGPLMALCRYLPEGQKSSSPVKATVRIKPGIMADSASATYDRLRILYRNTDGRVDVSVSGNGREIFTDTLRAGDKLNELVCRLDGADDIMIEFSGFVSPDIYGISIESSNGVIVDNIPQRGSAGLEFTMVDKNNLKESYKALQPDLFVLQYGLNVVRNVRTDYSYYMKGLTRQLTHLREVSPGTPVLMIGLTDMAEIKGDSIRSYPNIPDIIKAQKMAAVSQNVIFWDSWRAMGGNSSIVKWAGKQPPLAQKDLVHLTYRGADTLSGILIDSLFTLNEGSEADSSEAAENVVAEIASPLPETAGEPSALVKKSLAGSVLTGIFKYDQDKPMIFSSAGFWLFLLVVLAGYSIVYKKLNVRNLYLLLVSLFFYYKSGGLFLFLLILVIVIDFLSGLFIGHSRTKLVRKLFISLSLISNLGILAYFKYTGFIVNAVNSLMGTRFGVYDFLAEFSNNNLGTTFQISNIILPVGISFFTFQSMSYTIDVYRRKMEPVKNIIDFGFYVSFFPQLVAGPIVRASEFIPQLYKKYHLGTREFSHALYLISKGLIKKIVISDFIAVNFIDRVFDAPSMYSGFENLMAVYGYGLQIYCDFSGYTDIAIGLGLILGFRLPVNFNSPYKAGGISDFWRRWHISLSRWLKDYLYISLGGNRRGKFRTGINLMLTMLLGGLWHGADLRFILWGFLHGSALVLEKIKIRLFGRGKNGVAGRTVAVFFTFHFVSFCWIFFRAPDLDSVRIMLEQIAANFSPGDWSTVLYAYSNVFFLMGAAYLVHFLPERIKESYRGIFIKIPVAAQLTLLMLVAILLFSMRATDTMPFIYFRF